MPSKPEPPLSTLLSQALVAFTIELDNEFERRFEQAGGGARVASLVMWSNFLRVVGDGIAVGELPDAVGLQKGRVLSTLGGMERWRYVFVTAGASRRPPRTKRDGWGSARGLQNAWLVRPTPAGGAAAAIWPSLFDEIERRWRERFGAGEVDALERALRELDAAIELELPAYLPIVGSAEGMKADLTRLERARVSTAGSVSLTTLLSHVLLAYTLEFESDSELALAPSANVLRVLDDSGVVVRELPARAGVSKEAISMALTVLTRTDYVVVEGASAVTKTVRATPTGVRLRKEHDGLHARIAKGWEARFGADVGRLRTSLDRVLGHRDLSAGLVPGSGGWRATAPYAARTEAMIADPRAGLPHYPMVLHRGGWPDGS